MAVIDFSSFMTSLKKLRVQIDIEVHVDGEDKRVSNGNSSEKYIIILSLPVPITFSHSSFSGKFSTSFLFVLRVVRPENSTGGDSGRILSEVRSPNSLNLYILNFNMLTQLFARSLSLSPLDHVFFHIDPSMHAVDYRSSV